MNAAIIAAGALMIILINVFKKQIEISDRLDKITIIDVN